MPYLLGCSVSAFVGFDSLAHAARCSVLPSSSPHASTQPAQGALSLAAEQQGVIYGPAATGIRPAKDDKEKLSRLIDLVNERFGTLFDAQDIVDGVTQQLMDSEELQRAAKANPRANFDLVGAPAFDEALVDRHAKHAEFIDRLFADEELLRFIRTRVLDDIYARLTETSKPSSR